MEKRVREKTCAVDGSLEASTVEAMTAEFVEKDAGRLEVVSHQALRVRE